MSLILEALRKSEAERRRGEAPNVYSELSPSPRVRHATMPIWIWIVLSALVVVLAAVWMMMRRPQQPATPVVAAAPKSAPRSVVPRRSAATLPSVSHLSPASVATAPAAVSPAIRKPGAQAPATAVATMSAPAPPAASIPAQEDKTTMQLSDLSANERKALPPLKLSMHMWNDDRAQRFVILDGNRLREGDRIGDAVVTSINSDGVVLDWNGRRIKLPIR